MLKDGIAMVKFLRWLKPAVEKGGVTEMSADEKLTALRGQQPLFRGISFDTIAGYGEHGAIVHYEATPDTDIELKPEGFLLLDSGRSPTITHPSHLPIHPNYNSCNHENFKLK